MAHRVQHSEEEAEALTPEPAPLDGGDSGPKRRRWPLVVVLPLVLLLGVFGADRGLSSGRVMRGVTVAGVLLGGLDQSAAKSALDDLVPKLRKAELPIQVRAFHDQLKPGEVGFEIDVDATLGQAMHVGRQNSLLAQLGWWLSHWRSATDIAPVSRLDHVLLHSKVDEWQTKGIDDPPFEGGVVVRAGKLTADPPRAGWIVDQKAAASQLLRALGQRERKPLELPLVKANPVSTADLLGTALRKAATLVSQDVTLLYEAPTDPPPIPVVAQPRPANKGKNRPREKKADKPTEPAPAQRFTISAKVLTAALRSRPRDGGYDLYFDARVIDPALDVLRKMVESTPRDATFAITKRDEVQIVPARAGRVVDAQRVAEALLRAGQSPKREAKLPVEVGAAPEVKTEDLKQLNVRGLVSKFSTHHPCCQARVKNIHRIADLLDGTLLKPGQRFSINEAVGIRTAAKGFLPAPTIVNGEMKDTIGGGISQFATTFFNTAFYGGYDIVERAPHSYYFRRYPMGHEATLSFPKPDVIIRNDTDSGLLIRCFYTSNTITVKMYGDNGGRKVKRRVSRIRDLTKPPIEYEADPRLEPDEEKVVEKGQSGWSILVSRTIKYPDGTEKKEGRKVVYKPRVRKLKVHPCVIPEGKEGHTGEDCPEKDEDEEEAP